VGSLTALFSSTFTTLLAILNPLEALPIFLKLLDGQDKASHRKVARRACLYACGLMLFFLVFGNLVLRIFGVPLSMVRIVGGIILMRIGFSLFEPSPDESAVGSGGSSAERRGDIAFVPLAMPLMFGPGVLATVIGMSSTIKESRELGSFLAIVAAIVAASLAMFVFLAYARVILQRVGPLGVDAATRLVGFFVAAMGMGLIFHGLTDVLRGFGIQAK
jgi:multiple antibiotic resistance protein